MFYCSCFIFAFSTILGLWGLPKKNGKLKDLTKFDAGFFGVHHKQAIRMDPQVRILLELTYEAVIDAGKLRLMHMWYDYPVKALKPEIMSAYLEANL